MSTLDYIRDELNQQPNGFFGRLLSYYYPRWRAWWFHDPVANLDAVDDVGKDQDRVPGKDASNER